MSSLLPGLKAMLNYHPLFVHFPIAFWVGAVLFEAFGVIRGREESRKIAAVLLYLGTICALAAVGSGWLAEESVPETGPAHDVKELHETFMLISTSLAAGLSMIAFFTRRNPAARFRKILLPGLVALGILLGLGADRGAQLVYQYGTSVHWPNAQQQK
jgi:uncharacterized membrane protein